MTVGVLSTILFPEIVIMSFAEHFDNDRDIVGSLVDYSDYANAKETNRLKTTLQTDWNEAVVGWKAVVPFPLYTSANAAPNGATRKKASKYEKPTEFEEWLSDSKGSVKCVGDDFDEIPIPAWKANVEQGTYRYVTNNGYYRTMKFLSQNEKREWYTVNKRHPEKVSMSWQNRRFQKEIKRQLKRDLRIKVTAHGDTRVIRERTDLSIIKMHKEKSEIIHSDRGGKKDRTPRIKSVQSEIPLSNRNKSPYLEVTAPSDDDVRCDENGDVLPKSQSEPSNPSHFVKSPSSLFINNFTSRMYALERELERDRIRKPYDTSDSSPSKARAISPKTTKNTKDKEKELTEVPMSEAASQKSKELIQQEIMTVRSMIDISSLSKQDLRPIEKVTPAQRFKSLTSDGAKKSHSAQHTPTQIKYTNSTGSDAANLGVSSIPSHFTIASPELEKALHSYKLAIETTKQSLLSTLSGPKHARRAIGKNLSAPAAIAICDPDAVMEGSKRESFMPSKADRRSDVREKGAPFVVLPEISGKRMEVSTTVNRLL